MVLAEKAVQSHPVDAETVINRFVQYLVAEEHAGITIRVYKNAVHLFQSFLVERGLPRDLVAVQPEDVESFIAGVEETRSPGTAYSRYWGLRRFFEWQVNEGVIRESPVLYISQPRKPTKRSRSPIRESRQSMKASMKAT